MSEAFFAAALSALVQIIGFISASRLVSYRLSELEKRVDKHNNMVERMYRVEDRAKSNTHRLNALEETLERRDVPSQS